MSLTWTQGRVSDLAKFAFQSSEPQVDTALERVIGVGIDLVAISRIESAIKKHPRIVERLFSEEEQDYCSRAKDPWQRWASRFAAKEAVIKSLGASPGVMPWRMISVVSDRGRPRVRLLDEAAAHALSVGCERIEISITHHDDLAAAVAIALGRIGMYQP